MSTGKVLILEDDGDLAYTYEQLVVLATGHLVVIVRSFAALQIRREDALACDVAILDIDLGEGAPSGIDAYRWLRGQGYQGRIYFITGHGKSHPLVVQAVKMCGGAVYAKPLELDRFIGLITGVEKSNACD